jgi:hypothetical protein
LRRLTFKIVKGGILVGSLVCGAWFAQGAAFQNLGFDNGDTNALFFPGGGTGAGPSASLLPNWNVSQGGTAIANMGFNNSVPSLTIFSSDPHYGFPFFPVEGSYALQLSENAGDPPIVLTQDGQIPAGTVFLGYRYEYNPLSVTINGELLTPSSGAYQYAGTPSEVLFDVSQFAGENVELKLTTLSLVPLTPASVQIIDSIAFTVPEPSTTILLGLGCVGIGALALRRQRW